ncbi:hypothetical protein L209DRAFT_593994 [Thermothelomyces heterothallicus CBS 203.75]
MPCPSQKYRPKNQPVLQPFLLWKEGVPPAPLTQSAAHSKIERRASPSPSQNLPPLLPYKLPAHNDRPPHTQLSEYFPPLQISVHFQVLSCSRLAFALFHWARSPLQFGIQALAAVAAQNLGVISLALCSVPKLPQELHCTGASFINNANNTVHIHFKPSDTLIVNTSLDSTRHSTFSIFRTLVRVRISITFGQPF